LYDEARNPLIRNSCFKVFEVGMYWANIKGRFQGNSERGSTPKRRIYLAMKYGNIWLSKV
jgi:hypothetical protein